MYDEAVPRTLGAAPTAHATLPRLPSAAHPLPLTTLPTPHQVATGTGIAPYRSFIRRLFEEDTPASSIYAGEAWLFLGVANADALLYDDDWQAAKAKPTAAGGKLRVDYALSREGPKNKSGGKMYIQDKVEEYSDEVFAKLDNGAHIYFCGLKGMMPGIHDMLKTVCAGKGIDYAKWLAKLKKAKQWHVEVY